MSWEDAGGTPGSGATSDRLRALLSRAADEQVLEQRQVSALLGELRAMVEDLDHRLATAEQVERVAADVRALSGHVEARLDELAERIGQRAQDLADAVAAGVAERLEAQLRGVTTDVTSATAELVASSERRLSTHVDDAVLALAEVVLRRRGPGPRRQAPADRAPPGEGTGLPVPGTGSGPPDPGR